MQKTEYNAYSTVPAEHILNLAQSINRDAELLVLLIPALFGGYEDEWVYEERWVEIHKRIHEHVKQLGYDYPCGFPQLQTAFRLVGEYRAKEVATIDMITLKEYTNFNELTTRRIVF